MDNNQQSQKYHEMIQEKVYTNTENTQQEEIDMPTTRLKRKIEHKSKQKFILFSIATLVVLFVLLQYGIPFIINTTVFLSGGGKKDAVPSQQQNTFIATPLLDTTFEATNSAEVTISGTAGEDQEIKLYVNNRLVDSNNSTSDGSFTFRNVQLKSGTNTIKAKAVVDKQESEFSEEIEIAYKNKAPELTIDKPTDGQSFSKEQRTLTVSGKVTDPDATVTVNDFRAIVDGDGEFSYPMNLQNGENKIKVVVTDEAGNKTEKEIKVNYSE